MEDAEGVLLRVEDAERDTEALGDTVTVPVSLRLPARLALPVCESVLLSVDERLPAAVRLGGTAVPLRRGVPVPPASENVEDTLGLKLTLGEPEGARLLDTVREGSALRDSDVDAEGQKDTEGEPVLGRDSLGEELTEGERDGRTERVLVIDTYALPVDVAEARGVRVPREGDAEAVAEALRVELAVRVEDALGRVERVDEGEGVPPALPLAAALSVAAAVGVRDEDEERLTGAEAVVVRDAVVDAVVVREAEVEEDAVAHAEKRGDLDGDEDAEGVRDPVVDEDADLDTVVVRVEVLVVEAEREARAVLVGNLPGILRLVK